MQRERFPRAGQALKAISDLIDKNFVGEVGPQSGRITLWRGLELEDETGRLFRDGRTIGTFSPNEASFMYALMRRRGRVAYHEAIGLRVWRNEYIDRYEIRELACRVRRRLKGLTDNNIDFTKVITNVHGRGYYWSDEEFTTHSP